MYPTVAHPHRPPARRGFSFAEVMFAVVILGIGFIMVAAIFPVALQQTQQTAEDNAAAAAARGAADAIASFAGTLPNPVEVTPASPTGSPPAQPVAPTNSPTNPTVQVQRTLGELSLFPPTVKNYVLGTTTPPPGYQFGSSVGYQQAVPPAAIVVPFVGAKWDLIRANAVLPADPRFAYAAFYRREANSDVAQVIVVSVASRTQPTFDPNLLDGATPGNPGNLPATVFPSETVTTLAASPNSGVNTWVLPDTIRPSRAVPEASYATVNVQGMGSGPTGVLPPLCRTYLIGRTYSSGVDELLPGGDLTLTAGAPDVVTGRSMWGTAGGIRDAAASGVSATLHSTYNANSTPIQPGVPLQAVVAYVTLQTTASNPAGRMTLYATCDPADTTPCAVVANGGTGSFVIIADDFPCDPQNVSAMSYQLPPNFSLGATLGAVGITTKAKSFQVGAVNGRIFRLGQAVTQDLIAQADGTVQSVAYPNGTFDLDASYGMRPTPTDPYSPQYSPDTIPNPDLVQAYSGRQYQVGGTHELRARAYLIGPGSDPVTTVRGGAAQDAGCYTTYVPAH